ncbi:MAG: hypothetical protein ABFR75_09940 [Acidobacteriota bacterium]
MTKDKNILEKDVLFSDFFSILRKRKIVFFSVLITGIIFVIFFFKFIYPPQILSSRIFSGDLGNVFSLINNSNDFLSYNDIHKLIDPIIQLNNKEKQKYQILVKNTFKKEKIHNSLVNILDLEIRRTFSKSHEGSEGGFSRDMKDFFRKFEYQLFQWFIYRGKIEKLKILEKISNIKLQIAEDEKKISIVRKYKDIPSKNFKDILEINSSYLPPSQQYYGLVIERENRKRFLDLNKDSLEEINGTLNIISKRNLSLFSEIVSIEAMKQYEQMHTKLKLISENLIILRGKYILRGFSRGKNISGKFLMIFAFLILLTGSVIFISFIEVISKRNKS